MKKIIELIKELTQKQLFRFMLVGVSNTIVSYVFYLIVFFLSKNYIAGNFAGFVTGTINAYFWNSKFVFAERKNKPDYKQLAKTFASYGATFLLSTGSLYILINKLHINAVIAPIVNTVLIFVINFLLNKFWVYGKGEKDGAQ